jgi:hypothetical protein
MLEVPSQPLLTLGTLAAGFLDRRENQEDDLSRDVVPFRQDSLNNRAM